MANEADEQEFIEALDHLILSGYLRLNEDEGLSITPAGMAALKRAQEPA